jgi:lipopolysaccharide/colanic/teichoic acid biosynthesis glycosyltransferase
MEIPRGEVLEEQLFFMGKRLLDLVLALTFILCFLPFYLILAIITFASSRGPVIYRQERVGKNGHAFTMYKFRSMDPDAERHGPLLAVPDDPRITKWGRFMRKYKLDETPQFFNVILGSMSVVGPRPERAFWKVRIEEHSPQFNRLCRVKPGITSLGQVKFGYAGNLTEMRKRLRYDLLYLDKMSLWMDLRIIWMTLLVVLKGNGT